MLVLSLFPGIGLLDSAFESEGFTVVRGPDVLWGGDIREFHPPAGKFDGVIGGPPCQMFSSLARLVEANGHKTRFGNLIPEFQRCVAESQPDWFLMENVPAAPVPAVEGCSVNAITLDNSMVAGVDGFGQEQRRVRRFCFGTRGRVSPNLMRWIDLAVFLLPDPYETVTHGSLDNSKEARTRKAAVTSTDGGVRPSEKARVRHETIHAGHGKPPRTLENTVCSSNGGRGSQRASGIASNNGRGRYKLADACRLQGLPEDFLKESPFTADGKLKAVANGVPLPMGRAVAKAVREAIACQ